jgi:hypothetical protein
MVNVPRLRDALDYIVEHPDEWNQSNWIVRTDCGTAGCLAGVVAVKVMGAVPLFISPGVDATSNLEHSSIEDFDFITEHPIWEVDFTSKFAQLALDLTDDQALDLFEADNTLHDLFYLANVFTGGEIEIPEEIAVQPRRFDGLSDWDDDDDEDEDEDDS